MIDTPDEKPDASDGKDGEMRRVMTNRTTLVSRLVHDGVKPIAADEAARIAEAFAKRAKRQPGPPRPGEFAPPAKTFVDAT